MYLRLLNMIGVSSVTAKLARPQMITLMAVPFALAVVGKISVGMSLTLKLATVDKIENKTTYPNCRQPPDAKRSSSNVQGYDARNGRSNIGNP